jgi:hypothetical protein
MPLVCHAEGVAVLENENLSIQVGVHQIALTAIRRPRAKSKAYSRGARQRL